KRFKPIADIFSADFFLLMKLHSLGERFGNPHGFREPMIVEDFADPGLETGINGLPGIINILNDVIMDGADGARGPKCDAQIAIRLLSSQLLNIVFRGRPWISNEMIHREVNGDRFFECDLRKTAISPENKPVRTVLIDLLPNCLLV